MSKTEAYKLERALWSWRLRVVKKYSPCSIQYLTMLASHVQARDPHVVYLGAK